MLKINEEGVSEFGSHCNDYTKDQGGECCYRTRFSINFLAGPLIYFY